MTSTISTWLFHLRYIPSGHWGAAHVNNHYTQNRFVVIKQVSMFLLLYLHLYFLLFFFAQSFMKKNVSLYTCLYFALYYIWCIIFIYHYDGRFICKVKTCECTWNCTRQFSKGRKREADRLVTWWMITFRQNNHPGIPLTKKRSMTSKRRKSDLNDENWAIFIRFTTWTRSESFNDIL